MSDSASDADRGTAALPAAAGATGPTRHRARIAATGATFDAPADSTLLRAALDAGLVLRSSCRNGACRACMCRLLEGRVRYRVEWPSLSPDEKAEGWVLPCVAMPEADVVLREAPFGRE